jgi:hypothetical protein
VVGNGILWLVGGALQIGGWTSPPIAYVLLAAAFIWTVCSVIYWRSHKRDDAQLALLAESIRPGLSKSLKATGKLEDISRGDALWIMGKSILMQNSHGHDDFWGLTADRASNVPLNELMARPCSQCGIPRNQRSK